MALNIPPQDDKKDKNPQTNKDKTSTIHHYVAPNQNEGWDVKRVSHTSGFMDTKKSGTPFNENRRAKAMDVIIKLKDK